MDPRIVRTQLSLQQALLDLATEHELADITVADIADRAGVNRSTFYQHYSDKETLLADALDAAVEAAGLSVPTSVDPPLDAPPELVTFMQHVDEHADLYRWAVGSHGSAIVTDRIRVRTEALVRHHLVVAGAASPFGSIPTDVVAASIAGAGLGVIRAWLESEPRASVQIAADWLWRMLRYPGGALE